MLSLDNRHVDVFRPQQVTRNIRQFDTVSIGDVDVASRAASDGCIWVGGPGAPVSGGHFHARLSSSQS